MKIYVIQQSAVYNHDIFGVFTTVEGAVTVLETILRGDDGHHDYDIVEFELDFLSEHTLADDDKRNPTCEPKVVKTLNVQDIYGGSHE